MMENLKMENIWKEITCMLMETNTKVLSSYENIKEVI